MLKYITITLLLGVYCALSAPTLADNPQQVLDTLKSVDLALNQGSISYDMKSEIPKGLVNQHVRIDYALDGRCHQIVTGSTDGKPQSYEIIFDGINELWVFKDPNEIQFTKPKNLGEFGVSLGLRYLMGRGLSGLINKTVRQDSSGIHFSGTSANGFKYEALLDPTRAYLATEITLTDQSGNIRGKWHLSSPRNIGNGIYVAMKSTSDSSRAGTHFHSELSIQEMNTSEPAQDQFTYDWLKPGVQITDQRLGSTDMGIFQSVSLPPNTTPAQLLEMTRQQIASRAKLHAANEANKRTYDQQNATKHIAVAVVLACLAVIAIAAAIVWKKRSLSTSR